MTAPCIPREAIGAPDDRLAAACRRANAYQGALADVERLLRVVAMATHNEPPVPISADEAAALHFLVAMALDEIASAWREALQ